MLAVIKRNEQEFADWVATEVGFLTALGSYQEAPIRLEPYQLEFLSTPGRYRCVEKARQVGFSWLFAAEAVARGHLRDAHTAVFVSYNLADSKEKIAYCQQLHEELPLAYQKKRVVDSKLELAFQSNGASKRISRIISNPSKAPRGKKGDIYLDELAHYANDREVYQGSTALILRAQGQLTVCSSPLGRRGVFWEIARQEVRPYPAYWRQRCRGGCARSSRRTSGVRRRRRRRCRPRSASSASAPRASRTSSPRCSSRSSSRSSRSSTARRRSPTTPTS